MTLSRRLFVFGALGLPGCTALGSLGALGQSSPALDTYELQPVAVPAPRRRSDRTLLVLEPTAPAAIATERILIRQDPLSVTYLPDARWSDEVPRMLQSMLIRSLAASGGIGFVGQQGAGPVPDTVLLTRIDAFGVEQQPDGGFQVRVACDLTVLRDRDQRVLGTRRFAAALPVAGDRADVIARSFQHLLDDLLPQAVTWVLSRAAL